MGIIVFKIDVIDFFFFRAREECDILSFFRVLQHYGLMKRDREAVFEKLVDRFNDTDVHVEVLSPSRLKFEASV